MLLRIIRRFETVRRRPWGGLFLLALAGLVLFPVAARSDPSLTALVQFDGPNGGFPVQPLVISGNGNLIGATAIGGASYVNDYNQLGDGTVFEINGQTHAFETIASFNQANGQNPSYVVLNSAGDMFGTTEDGQNNLGAIYEIPAGTQNIEDLASFNGPNGAFPSGGVYADSSGNLFGTTYKGGTSYSNPNNAGDGTIFEYRASTHTLSAVFTFNGTDGYGPLSNLIPGQAGNLYGTTSGGGTGFNGTSNFGNGTVFKFTPGANTLSTLGDLASINGNNVNGGLVADAHGNLYGLANTGGAHNWGTIFEIPAGTDTVNTIYSFSGPDGASPVDSLIIDAAGDLFGVTANGGVDYDYNGADNDPGDGTVFEFNVKTDVLTTLVSFDIANGQYPQSGLVADSQGNLYGTSESSSNGFGEVYELTGSGFVVPEPASSGIAGLIVCSVFALGRPIARQVRS